MPYISIIIPVYKQEKTVKSNLKKIIKSLESINKPFEIIVVVDGFMDRSLQNARKVKDKRVLVTGYKTNKGKGYAVRFGFAKAKSPIIGFIDGGGDLGVHSIPIFIELFNWKKADVVIGSKRHPDSKVTYPVFRRAISWIYQVIVRILFGLNVRDTQVGLKLYKRELLEKVLPRLLVKKFAFDIELLAVANRLGYKNIVEAPIELNYRFSSSITSKSLWSIALNMLKDTLAVFYRLKIIKYYDSDNKRKWKFDPELNFRVNIG